MRKGFTNLILIIATLVALATIGTTYIVMKAQQQRSQALPQMTNSSAVDKICSWSGLGIRVLQCGQFYVSLVGGVADEWSAVYDANGNSLYFSCGANSTSEPRDPRCSLLKNCKVVKESCSNPLLN